MNSDWLQQVNRIEKSYEALFREVNHSGAQESILGITIDDTKKTYHGENRFPPRARPQTIGSIDNEEYVLYSADIKMQIQNSDVTLQVYAKSILQKLEGIQLKIRENREKTRARDQYLSSLTLRVPDNELPYLSEVSLELRALGDEAAQLLTELDSIQFARPELNTAQEQLPAGITSYCQQLRVDASRTTLQLDALLALAEDMLYAPRGEVCRLDGIEPDWSSQAALQASLMAAPVAARALRYSQDCLQRGQRLCPPLYDFLCDPRLHANMLAICGYNFAPGQLAAALAFLVADRSLETGATAASQTVHELLLEDCGLGDVEVAEVAKHLPAFEALHTLSLRGNAMTSAGLTNIATVLWELGLPLRALHLDRNRVGPEGAMMLAKSLHRCRFLQRLSLSHNPIGDAGFFYIVRATMNPYRRARRSLPRPIELAGEDEEREGFHSDDEDSEPESESDCQSSDDDDDDAFTAVDDDESAYSVRAEYLPSRLMTRRALVEVDLAKRSREHYKYVLSTRTLLQRWFGRVRVKLMAVAAWMRLRSRGHNMHTLEAMGCGLGPFSLRVASHALSDNHNLATLALAENAIGHSEYETADTHVLVRLAQETGLCHLDLRQAGLFEQHVEALVRALNRPHATLQSIDLGGNHLGPSGANMVAGLSSFFVDRMGVGSGYSAPPVLSRSDLWADRAAPVVGKGLSQSKRAGNASQAVSVARSLDEDNDFEGDDGRFIDKSHLAQQEEMWRRGVA